MRNIFFFAVLLACLTACKSDAAKSNETAEEVTKVETIKGEISISGHWINDKYLAVLLSSQSPRKAQEACEWCFLDIPPSADLPMLVIVNYHEAIQYHLAASDSDVYTILPNGHDAPEPQFNAIVSQTADKIKLGDQTFIRAQCAKEENTFKILEYYLFQGNYTTESGKEVEFTSNGEIKGLDDFTAYNPFIDYFDMGRDVDQVSLKNSNETWTDYAFRFKQNKLQILALECKSRNQFGNCEEVKFGEVVYTLRKK